MKIGGLRKVSLIDYPHRICAVIFTQGCNFRCPYCHNPELVDPDLYSPTIPEEEVLSFLGKRLGRLDAVTVSGGEPTIHSDLPRMIRGIKAMGYLLKLDTNGSHPDCVEKLIEENLVDYIAMDIKGPLEKYGVLTGAQVPVEDIRRCIEIITASGIEHEFRTTAIKSMLTEKDLIEVGSLLGNARQYVLQKFVPSTILDQNLLTQPMFTDEELMAIGGQLKKKVPCVTFR